MLRFFFPLVIVVLCSLDIVFGALPFNIWVFYFLMFLLFKRKQ